jgi:hypothetical protein
MTAVLPLRPAYDLADPTTLTLDLANPKPKEVLALHEAFATTMRANSDAGPLPVNTGWHDITPAIATNLLLRNKPGANRWLDPATVFYYANQMARGDWKATGQPILINVNGDLKDAQHRLYAGLISGQTFRSYVITDIEDIPHLFVYIDNGRVRGVPAALQTAGYNGVSSVIAKVMRFAEEVNHGVFNSSGETRLPRMSPAQMLNLVASFPNVQQASRSAVSDWAEVVKYVGKNRRDVVAYVGMRIIDEHGESVADDFFEDLLDASERAADHPIAALRKEIDKDHRATKQMKRQHLAAIMIVAFNAWVQQETLGRGWKPAINDDFPEFAEAQPQQVAAE